MEPTCNRPRFVDGATTYDYCGRTHARQHMKSVAQLWSQDTTGHGSTSGTRPQISRSQPGSTSGTRPQISHSQPMRGLNLAKDLNYGKLISVV